MQHKPTRAEKKKKKTSTHKNAIQIPATKQWADLIKFGSMLKIVTEPLNHFGVARTKQGKNPIAINRHDVLHGTCVDYGDNEVDAFKTLSLLSYIGIVIRDVSDSLKEIRSGVHVKK